MGGFAVVGGNFDLLCSSSLGIEGLLLGREAGRF